MEWSWKLRLKRKIHISSPLSRYRRKNFLLRQRAPGIFSMISLSGISVRTKLLVFLEYGNGLLSLCIRRYFRNGAQRVFHKVFAQYNKIRGFYSTTFRLLNFIRMVLVILGRSSIDSWRRRIYLLRRNLSLLMLSSFYCRMKRQKSLLQGNENYCDRRDMD